MIFFGPRIGSESLGIKVPEVYFKPGEEQWERKLRDEKAQNFWACFPGFAMIASSAIAIAIVIQVFYPVSFLFFE